MRGRYASYWNAFLYLQSFNSSLFVGEKISTRCAMWSIGMNSLHILLVPAPASLRRVHHYTGDLTDRVTYQRLRHGVYVILTRLSEEFGQGASAGIIEAP